ncbi:hypothetical protein L3X38_045078 [Prunus dulcis]|uniref:Ankyrin repeat family protein n=1 Tax=Prunus dulcis TaxID=3755 RepID=A0AAD4V1Z4_PRUDU|nr:hypothetical protein L3X38_045078 [Prunus dulcis]
MTSTTGDIALHSSVRWARKWDSSLLGCCLYGKKDAFLCLHYIYIRTPNPLDGHSERHGDTILHCAIAGGLL